MEPGDILAAWPCRSLYPPKISVTSEARYESHQGPAPATENALCISLVQRANPR